MLAARRTAACGVLEGIGDVGLHCGECRRKAADDAGEQGKREGEESDARIDADGVDAWEGGRQET